MDSRVVAIASSSHRRNGFRRQSLVNLTKYNLFKEADRLATFIDNGYSNGRTDIQDLALTGFYFYRNPKTVRCAFCYVTIDNFEIEESVLGAHLRLSPNCPLLFKRRPTGNVPINEEVFNRNLPTISSYDICGLTSELQIDENKYPEYRYLQARLKTFGTWPVSIKVKPEKLAEAGFFYSGQSDLVTCFSCGLFLNNWENSDNPWVEHKKWLLKECNYLNMNQETLAKEEKKYEEFRKLQGIETDIETLKTKELNGKDEKEQDKDIDFENVCKICLDRKSEIIFLPCRHVAVCGTCVFGIGNKCPICRSEIKEKISVIYS